MARTCNLLEILARLCNNGFMSDEIQGPDPIVQRMRALVEKRGEREVLKALMDTPLDFRMAEQLVTGRYNARPKGTNRNILEAFLDEQERAS
jgi:hypothetical protein